MPSKLIIFALIFSYAASVEGKDLGRYGETWEIREKDAILEIKEKLGEAEKTGELKKHNDKLLENAKKQIKRPKAVEYIRHTTEERDFIYDPSFSYPHDLKDHKGKVFYKAGTIINPLDYVSLPYKLIFLDGDDKKQEEWALKLYEQAAIKPLLILVKGEPLTLSEKHDIHFYFDQFGYTSKKLGINQVPAIVNQEGRNLRIREIILKRVL